jgi:hypothetical protein
LYIIEPESERVLWADFEQAEGAGAVDMDDFTGELADITEKLPNARRVEAE